MALGREGLPVKNINPLYVLEMSTFRAISAAVNFCKSITTFLRLTAASSMYEVSRSSRTDNYMEMHAIIVRKRYKFSSLIVTA